MEEDEEMDLVEEGWTWPDPEKYRYVKRTPQRPFSEGSVLYISRQSKQKAVIKRVNELLREKGGCAIAGLGAAVRTAVRIALAVRRLYASDAGLQVWPTTTTVKLVDDFEPLVDGLSAITRVRYNSAVVIYFKKLAGT